MLFSSRPNLLVISFLLYLLLVTHTAAQTTTLTHNFASVTPTVATTSSSSPTAATTTIVHNFHTTGTGSKLPVTATKTVDDDGPVCTPSRGKDCAIDGNADFYGLGVRLGIYFSWVTSWIANNFLPEEMGGSFDTNSIFLLSIIITTLYYSIKYQIFILDALILLHLSFGFMFSVMSLWGYRTMYYRREGLDGQKYFGGWGTHFRLLLMGAISIYALWFWTEGLNDGLPKCNMRNRCGGLKTFMFAEVNIYGPIRTAYAISAGACCLFYGIMILAAIASGLNYVFRYIANRKSEWELQTISTPTDGLSRNELTYANLAMTGFNFFWMVFAAVNVEFTLNFNHVDKVLGRQGLVGAGQLLPAFIGTFSFVRVMYLLFREYYLERRHEEKAIHGLGMTGTTAATMSPSTPGRKTTGGTRRQRHFVHRLISAWLPWLGAFEFWRGDQHSFELLSEARSYPITPITPDVEMRRRIVKPGTEDGMSGGDDRVDDDEDTEYRGSTYQGSDYHTTGYQSHGP